MPTECCVFGCTNNSAKDAKDCVKRSYFQIPKVKSREGEIVHTVTENRRREWITQINRKGLTFDTARPHHKVCSDHFITGKPAYEMRTEDPDWKPTLKLGHQQGKKPSTRGIRLKQRQLMKRMQEDSTNSAENSMQSTLEDDLPVPEASNDQHKLISFHKLGKLYRHKTTRVNTAVQTSLTSAMVQTLEDEFNRLTAENVKLKSDVAVLKYTENAFENNDKKVKFFTGLQNWTSLILLFNFLKPDLPSGNRSALTNFEMLILTFLRLRFNLPLQLLGYMFSITRTTASSYFHKTLNVMYWRLKNFIIWPEREVLRKTQPTEFRNAFGGRISVIIDCFEIFIESSSDLLARAQTFSHYKHHNTIKYLIGITPTGNISFISKGWGGRTSDKYVVEHSKFLNYVLPGDIILADRGFDIAEVVAIMQAEVKIPAFTKGKAQLSACEVESTRKIAHLRIHVERVIGSLCGKYGILNGVIPLEMMSIRQGDTVTTLDMIVTVCCAMVNHCPSVVTNK